MTKRKIGSVKPGATAYRKADLRELEILTTAFRAAARLEHAKMAEMIRQAAGEHFTQVQADELAWGLLKLTKEFNWITDEQGKQLP
jgi:hypothetical protein